MNLLFFKYAVEIANTMSISKAAENLYMGQPNLSRAIKELEKELGISIFHRTTKGISITPEGEEFLLYAKKILRQIEFLENRYKKNPENKQHFSVCAPRAEYISQAFVSTVKTVRPDSPSDVVYKEVNAAEAIANVIREDFGLAVIRYQEPFDSYYKNLFSEKELIFETVAEFSCRLLVSQKSPLAGKKELTEEDLAEYVEIFCLDLAALPPHTDIRKTGTAGLAEKRMKIDDRSACFSLLGAMPHAFLRACPEPEPVLARYGLVQSAEERRPKRYKDVLIYRKDYRLSELDHLFLTELCESKRRFF